MLLHLHKLKTKYYKVKNTILIIELLGLFWNSFYILNNYRLYKQMIFTLVLIFIDIY